MRSLLVFVVLMLAVAGAAVAASIVLLGSTGGNDRVGHLSPVALLPTAPVRTTPVAPPPQPTESERRGESDD